MERLEDLLRKSVEVMVEHSLTHQNSPEFRQGLDLYLSDLLLSTRYRHHSGKIVEKELIKKRFVYEAALLHILTNAFSRNLDGKAIVWPVYEATSPYSWFQFSANSSGFAQQIADQFTEVERPEVIASLASNHVLDKVDRRLQGEFYTPLPIVLHLIASSGFHPSELVRGKRIIDPACGAGIILATIARQTITMVLDQGGNVANPLHQLSQNLFGFDIQPFAVALTRTLLIYNCRSVLSNYSGPLPDPLFPNIQLRDTLLTEQYWTEAAAFDYIIGNPPFMATKKDGLDLSAGYQEVLYGHPNLYQLFIWWAVRAAVPRGIISFLLPQSMLSGIYFHKLRDALDRKTTLLSITRMTDWKGIIGDTQQQMMAACFRVEDHNQEDKVLLRVVNNGADIAVATPYRAKYSRVVQNVKEGITIWVVSDHAADYAICEHLAERFVPLGDLGEYFRISNGGYVWNQHEALLRTEFEKDALPLVSAASIKPFCFEFPYIGSHGCHARQFSLVDDTVLKFVQARPTVLVQRTTPEKVGRRLVAGITPIEFFSRYPRYFLENHVNSLNAAEDSFVLLYGLMGWLNSDLINFVFQLWSGTGQVSLFDTQILPTNIELIKLLAENAKAAAYSNSKARASYIERLNETIYDWVELGPRYRNRITLVLSRRNGGRS